MFKQVKITNRDIKRAEAFADKRVAENQNLYKKRGGFKRSDIVTGALAEIAAYKLLTENSFEVCKPDFRIHCKKGKSYDADLHGEGKHFHVKGQSLSSVERYGKSWLMQRRDPLITKPASKHYIVPCVVDKEIKIVYIYGIIPIRTLHDRGCFGECKVPSFRSTKIALYLDYMESVLTKNSMWGILWRN